MCKRIEGSEYLAAGWGCCGPNCNTYNGDQRNECKFCSHTRCEEPTTKVIPYKKPNGNIVLQTIKTPKSGDGLN